MSKWQLRVKCLKKRDKLFEQNHHFHFSIVTCLLTRTDVSLFCVKQKRTCEVWNTGSYTNTTTNSRLLTANPLPQTVPTEPPDDSGSIRAGFAVPKAQMTSFSPPYTYKHCVISPCTSSARESQACATCIVCVLAPSDSQLSWFCSQRKDTISHQSLVSSLMGSSWCNDTVGFDILVVDEEGGSEGMQCSTVGLHLWKCWTKGQLLLLTPFTA